MKELRKNRLVIQVRGTVDSLSSSSQILFLPNHNEKKIILSLKVLKK